MQGGNLGLWKSECISVFPPSFPGCPSTSLPHCLTRGWSGLHPARRRDFTSCLLEGQLGTEGGCLQSAPAAPHPAFNRQGRNFLWTAFLKELTEDYELCSDYVSFDSERINLHLDGGQLTVRSVLYSVFSEQAGQEDSLRWQREEREYMHIPWIPSSVLWTQGRNECSGLPGQRSGEFQAQQIKAWLRGAFGVKLQREKTPLLLCDPRYQACWMLEEQQCGQGGRCAQKGKEREINLCWCAWASN